MTEREWLECEDPEEMLGFLRGKAGERKLRLFAVACCRAIWHLLRDSRSRVAIEVAERYADNLENKMTLCDSRKDAIEAANAVHAPFGLREAERMKLVAYAAGRTASEGWDTLMWAAEAIAPTHQLWKLRDIFGNPFRPVSIDPAWLTPTVIDLAQSAYEERIMPSGELDPDRLAVLSDCLEEGGCDDEDILGHLRSAGPHVRGCWALDLLLGKS